MYSYIQMIHKRIFKLHNIHGASIQWEQETCSGRINPRCCLLVALLVRFCLHFWASSHEPRHNFEIMKLIRKCWTMMMSTKGVPMDGHSPDINIQQPVLWIVFTKVWKTECDMAMANTTGQEWFPPNGNYISYWEVLIPKSVSIDFFQSKCVLLVVLVSNIYFMLIYFLLRPHILKLFSFLGVILKYQQDLGHEKCAEWASAQGWTNSETWVTKLSSQAQLFPDRKGWAIHINISYYHRLF